MSPMRLNITVLGVVVALSAGFAFGLLVPGFKRLKQSEAQTMQCLAKVREDQSAIGNVSEIYAALLRMDEEMKGFGKRLPGERQFGEFLNEVTGCLKQSEVTDYSLAPRAPISLDEKKLSGELSCAKDVVILPMGLSFRGNFAQAFSLLDCLEHLERLSQVEKLSLTNDEKHPGSLKVDLVLHTYYQTSSAAEPAHAKEAP